jgi:glycosyltransferase involved in cell wall biosynthesis
MTSSNRGGGQSSVGDELISVIIPAYNAEPFIQQSVSSALQQTHRALEVIVVDDGSTDKTGKIVQKIALRDPRVRLIQCKNKGVSAARNLAIAQARGHLIAPLDADDIWHPQKLMHQLAVLNASTPDVGVVYCWSAGIDADDRVILPSWNNSTVAGDVLHAIVVSGIAGNGSTPLIRKDCIAAAGGYDVDLTLCEDWKFYTALAGVCRFAVVTQYLTGYRFHKDSASLNVSAMERAIAQVTAWIEQTWPQLPARLLRERSYTINAYLAFLAVRTREFRKAFCYLGLALRAQPMKLFVFTYWQLFLLLFAHAVGLRTYRWHFWRRPVPFAEYSAR